MRRKGGTNGNNRSDECRAPRRASRRLFGSVLEPGTDGYDAARRVHNGLIDRRPALIARCQNAADIADAIRFARANNLEICVRGGGHNVAGRAVIDDAIMIDLSPMKGIRVDPAARTARAQGGVIWRELNRETAAHGLAVTGGAISTTGIAGLTLGGGLGWLMAKYGLAADNLIGVELVTADGAIVDVTADSDPDLFWALCGGGGNFGVAASFEYRAPPGEHGCRRADRPPDRRRLRDAPLLPRCSLLGLRRPHGLRRGRPRSRRLGHEARGDDRLPHRNARRGGARAGAVQGLGLTARGRGRPDAVPGHEHRPGRRTTRRAPSTTGSRASPTASRTA